MSTCNWCCFWPHTPAHYNDDKASNSSDTCALVYLAICSLAIRTVACGWHPFLHIQSPLISVTSLLFQVFHWINILSTSSDHLSTLFLVSLVSHTFPCTFSYCVCHCSFSPHVVTAVSTSTLLSCLDYSCSMAVGVLNQLYYKMLTTLKIHPLLAPHVSPWQKLQLDKHSILISSVTFLAVSV